jgi:hypothetical protein
MGLKPIAIEKNHVIARRNDVAIPDFTGRTAKRTCTVGDCFVPRNDAGRKPKQ